jgi:hypothetical protein
VGPLSPGVPVRVRGPAAAISGGRVPSAPRAHEPRAARGLRARGPRTGAAPRGGGAWRARPDAPFPRRGARRVREPLSRGGGAAHAVARPLDPRAGPRRGCRDGACHELGRASRRVARSGGRHPRPARPARRREPRCHDPGLEERLGRRSRRSAWRPPGRPASTRDSCGRRRPVWRRSASSTTTSGPGRYRAFASPATWPPRRSRGRERPRW